MSKKLPSWSEIVLLKQSKEEQVLVTPEYGVTPDSGGGLLHRGVTPPHGVTPDSGATPPVEAPISRISSAELSSESLVERPPDSALSAQIRVEPKEGYTQLPNAIFDNLLRLLDPPEQLVLLRLYRLTYGFQRDICEVGVKSLCEATRIGKSRVALALNRLESLGLIERYGADLRSPNAQRAGRIRVISPEGVTPARGVTPESGATPAGGVTPDSGDMKYKKKKNIKGAPVAIAPARENLSVYDVRRIAARFTEVHHGESNYTKERLRADIKTALLGAGEEPDDRLIDDALG